ncbi:DUF3426 domain-containing protein [Undibacterium sp.]|uniref:DUF3426 domain-containing protein n=1 Tax=Undibacterium sp. TaxID=1914977 RepID=UPI00374CF146
MALATQCPHCHTTFRVANDQLKLHAGIVRCGSCQQIFNGIEHLVAPGATPNVPATPSTTPAAPSTTQGSARPDAIVDTAANTTADTAVTAAQQAQVIRETPETLAHAETFAAEAASPEHVEAMPLHEKTAFSSDMLDFDEEVFTEPLPFANKPAAVQPAPEPATAAVTDDDEAERQHRMALLVEAETDWSIADAAPDAHKLARDALLDTDTKVFLPAADALLADESLQQETAEEAAAEEHTASHFDSEAEFHPELLSEFEAAYESEFDAVVADNGQAISLAEPESGSESESEAESEAELEAGAETVPEHSVLASSYIEEHAEDHAVEDEHALPESAPHADAGVGAVADAAINDDAYEEPLEPETIDAYTGSDAEQALEAASIRAEHIGDNISDVLEPEAPDFVVQAERKQARSKTVRIAMIAMSVLLFFALLAQAAYMLRNQLAAWLPQYKPMLVDVCKSLNCQISLLTQIDAVSIESNELQAMAPDKNIFSLTLLLHNKSSTLQAWPMLELTLDNDKDQPVLRKVFTPAEYLANKGDLVKGFPGPSEQSVKLYFELETLKAAGYHVWLFYP